jgi:hypothetical protein
MFRCHFTFLILSTSVVYGADMNLKDGSAKIPHSEQHDLASETLSKILRDDTPENRCITSTEDVIAIHAAWRRLDLSLRRQKEAPNSPRKVEDSAEYFVGFIEGRLEVICPEWWKEAILSTAVHESGHLAFNIPDEKGERLVHEKMRWPAGTKIVEEDGGLLHIIRGNQRIDAPKALIHEEANGSRQVDFITVNGSVFIAFCPPHASISLLKLREKKKKWTQNIRGEWFVGTFFGPGERQRVEIVISKGRIFVFAGSESVVYLEAFDANDGNRVARFSSRAYKVEDTK